MTYCKAGVTPGWTKEDDQWLYALWVCSRHKVEAVASVLGRTCASVTQRASVKGWKRNR